MIKTDDEKSMIKTSTNDEDQMIKMQLARGRVISTLTKLPAMTDVPEIPLDQIQQRVVAMWMGSFYGSSGYIARRLGKKGLREFRELGARQMAAIFKRIGLTSPLDVALAIATNEKNLFGSTVEVTEGDGYAEIKRIRCALLEGASAFSRLGATLIAKEHCKTCRESHWRKVFTELGMSMESEEIDGGCVMKIFKK